MDGQHQTRFCTAGLLMLLTALLLGLASSPADATNSGSNNFFLKASKSVPRIGRRSGGGDDTFFLKASKSVPRIGRRGSPWEATGVTEVRDNGGWPWFRTADNIPSRANRAGLRDGPALQRLAYNLPAGSPQVWHSLSAEADVDDAWYDAGDDDVEASQMLAPPSGKFARLPLENYSRQRRAQEFTPEK